MARRPDIATADIRVIELSRRIRSLAHELAGPDASFEQLEAFVAAIRAEVELGALREEQPATTPDLSVPHSARAKPRRR